MLLKFIPRSYRHQKIAFLLFFYMVWMCQSAPIQATETSKAPLVLLGDINAKKNYTTAALLGTTFTWFHNMSPFLGVRKEEKKKIYKKYRQPLLPIENYFDKNAKEKTVLYNHPDLPYPLYNVEGFGESGIFTSFQKNPRTQAANQSLAKILKKPIKGFLLHVRRDHLDKRSNKPSLNIMDFLLPHFKDIEAIKRNLSSSACLVITGFGSDKLLWDDVEIQRKNALHSLRKSMKTCYTAFHKAEQGTEVYALLAKQKAFYDIFLENPEQIKPNKRDRFNLDDFKLNFKKVIFFDPEVSIASVPVDDSSQVDITPLYKVVSTFKNASHKPKYDIEKPTKEEKQDIPSLTPTYAISPLWGIPIAGAIGGLKYNSYRPHKKKNAKKPTKTSKPTAKQDKLANTNTKKQSDK